jgi:hypothetical protein
MSQQDKFVETSKLFGTIISGHVDLVLSFMDDNKDLPPEIQLEQVRHYLAGAKEMAKTIGSI